MFPPKISVFPCFHYLFPAFHFPPPSTSLVQENLRSFVVAAFPKTGSFMFPCSLRYFSLFLSFPNPRELPQQFTSSTSSALLFKLCFVNGNKGRHVDVKFHSLHTGLKAEAFKDWTSVRSATVETTPTTERPRFCT